MFYYLPQSLPIKTDKLHPDLQNVLDDTGYSYREVTKGPDGVAGVVLSVHPPLRLKGDEQLAEYNPVTQKWKECDGYWCGYNISQPPTSESLERNHMVSGEVVRINDQNWTVPIVSMNWGQITLPQGFKKTKDGVTLQVMPAYQSLVDEADKWWDRYVAKAEEDAPQFQWADFYSFAVKLLNVNYRLTEWECDMDMLGLVRSDNFWDILNAALAVNLILKELEAKKKIR